MPSSSNNRKKSSLRRTLKSSSVERRLTFESSAIPNKRQCISSPNPQEDIQHICERMTDLSVRVPSQKQKMKRKSNLCAEKLNDCPLKKKPAEDKLLFTFEDLQSICERKILERESELLEEYGKLLSIKMAEQYDKFIKFEYDFLMSPIKSSYLS